MRLAVQEALALMADAFKDLDETNMKIMEALLMEAIDKVIMFLSRCGFLKTWKLKIIHSHNGVVSFHYFYGRDLR